MTVETFFEKFELFADAPGAVERMRDLVLHFAITGKLVATRADDLPIDQTYKDLVKHTVSPSWHLPANWRAVPLGFLGDWRGGGTPSKARADYWKGDIPWVSPKDMKTYSIDDAQDHVSPEAIDNCSAKLLPPGSILMVVRGMILVHTFPVAVTTRAVVINQDMKALTPTHSRLTEYILLTLRALESQVLRAVERSSHGTCKLRTDVLESMEIPLPPLPEQKRIVAKVDELMALCDRLAAQQQERDQKHAALSRAALARFAEAPTPANLEYLFHQCYTIDPADLRKSILSLAVLGKLVDFNPSSGALLPQSAPADVGLFDVPSHWQWWQLGSLLIAGPTNGISPKAVARETPVRSLTLTATTSGRFRGEHFKYLDIVLPDDSDVWLKDGDILVQRGNTKEYVGVAAVYRGADRQFVYPDLMMRLRLSSSVHPEFAHLAMSSEPCRDFLRARASGTTGTMPKINQATLRALPIPIPPLAEQKRIVAKVEALMALVDRLEAQQAQARDLATRLLSAAVAELTASPDDVRNEVPFAN